MSQRANSHPEPAPANNNNNGDDSTVWPACELSERRVRRTTRRDAAGWIRQRTNKTSGHCAHSQRAGKLTLSGSARGEAAPVDAAGSRQWRCIDPVLLKSTAPPAATAAVSKPNTMN